MQNLDKIDQKIIAYLDKNSRAPLTKIARHTHSSVQVVKYRLEKYIQNNIITDFWPMIDFRKIGLINIAYFFKLKNISSTSEKELYTYLNQQNNINIVMRGDGFWDLHITISTQGLFANQKIFEKFYQKFYNFIITYQAVLSIGFYQFPRKYLSDKKQKTPQALTGDDVEQVKLTQIQKNILIQVNKNSRITYNQLAEQVCISRQSAVKNLAYLEKNGIIQSYTIWPNHKKIGFSLYRTLLEIKNFDQQKYQDLFNFCAQHPNVINFLKLMGSKQLLLDFEISSRHDLRDLIATLKNKFSQIIENIEPTLVYKIDKFRDIPKKLI